MANFFAFIDESGVLDVSSKEQPYFAVGFLKIADTSVIGEKLTQRHYDYFSSQKEKRRKLIDDLRSNPRVLAGQDLNLLLLSTRHYEYKFTDVTPTTLARYKSFINTALEYPLYFCALVIDKTDPLFDQTIYKNYWSAYIKYSKLLCQKNCSVGDRLCVIADYMNKPRETDVYFERELNALPNIFHTLRAHSETFMLLQVCDLLLGSVVFQWKQSTGLVSASHRADAKREFVTYVVNKLQIPSNKQCEFPLAQSITCSVPIYLSVWPLRLFNTKSGGV